MFIGTTQSNQKSSRLKFKTVQKCLLVNGERVRPVLTRRVPLMADRKPNSANWRLPHPLQGENSTIIPQVQPTLHTYVSSKTVKLLKSPLHTLCPWVLVAVLRCFQTCADPRQLILDPVRGGGLLVQTAPKDHPVKAEQRRQHNALFVTKVSTITRTLQKVPRKIQKVSTGIINYQKKKTHKKYQKTQKVPTSTDHPVKARGSSTMPCLKPALPAPVDGDLSFRFKLSIILSSDNPLQLWKQLDCKLLFTEKSKN